MDDLRTPDSSPADIAEALRLTIGRLARRIRQAHAVGDLTLSERSEMARLDRDGALAPGVLAELERVRPQAMASTLATLEERGLVSRRQDPADGRRAVMTVTDAGRKVLADRRSESVRNLAAAIEEEFTHDERSRLLELLPLLDRLEERLGRPGSRPQRARTGGTSGSPCPTPRSAC
jgi:DNA-binding MarR family transcriptional regulator